MCFLFVLQAIRSIGASCSQLHHRCRARAHASHGRPALGIRSAGSITDSALRAIRACGSHVINIECLKLARDATRNVVARTFFLPEAETEFILLSFHVSCIIGLSVWLRVALRLLCGGFLVCSRYGKPCHRANCCE